MDGQDAEEMAVGTSRKARRNEILDAAVAVLAERGYRGATMLAVAQSASASKETIYAWFGDKPGLFEAVIRRNAEAVRNALAPHVSGDRAVQEGLVDFGEALTRLLLGNGAVAINRAAVSEATENPELARLLAREGRDTLFPLFIRFLTLQARRGTLALDEPSEAGEVFLGLLLGDLQVRRLLGLAPSPSQAQCRDRATRATRLFLQLYGTPQRAIAG